MSKVLTSAETCPKRWKPLASCSSLSPRILLLKSWLRRFHERKQQIGGKRGDLERKQLHWRQDWETRISMKAHQENRNTPQPSLSSVMLQPAGSTAHAITTAPSSQTPVCKNNAMTVRQDRKEALLQIPDACQIEESCEHSSSLSASSKLTNLC